ncbi:hypothetical protein GCM10025787_59370 [Saccharopolyspora rosea]
MTTPVATDINATVPRPATLRDGVPVLPADNSRTPPRADDESPDGGTDRAGPAECIRASGRGSGVGPQNPPRNADLRAAVGPKLRSRLAAGQPEFPASSGARAVVGASGGAP